MADGEAPPAPQVLRAAPNTPTELEKISLSWSAPLPPPGALSKYNEAFDGCAERIVKMAEGEAAHRHSTLRRGQRNDFTIELGGLIAGTVLTGILLVGGIWLISEGKVTEGFGALATGVAGVIGALIAARRKEAGS